MTSIYGIWIWSCFRISMNFPNCCFSLAFLILLGKGDDNLSWTNMGSMWTSGISLGCFSWLEVMLEIFKVHFYFVTCSSVGSTKGVTSVDSDTSTPEVSGVVRFYVGGSSLVDVDPSHSFPLLNFITLNVSIILASSVDIGVFVELRSVPIVLELSAQAIWLTWFSKFFILTPWA